MKPPTDFLARLASAFSGRLRIRWSLVKNEWHIEQQVGRAALPPLRITEADDSLIRARDGYAFVMAIKNCNHSPCRHCGKSCRVPELRSGEIKCERCSEQKRAREFGGYWPLGDALLDHLRKIDPYRDGHKVAAAEQDLQDTRRELTRQRNIFNTIESATLDDKYQLFDTPFSGYTGKVKAGSSIHGRSI